MSEFEKRIFVPAEECLTPQLLETSREFFSPIADEMSAILGIKVEVSLGVEEQQISTTRNQKRFSVNFIDQENRNFPLARINWLLQNSKNPEIMEDGVVSVIDQRLRGNDFGYQMLVAKRKIGHLLGYKYILLNSMGSTYPEQITNRSEEEDYEWKELHGAENPYVGLKTFKGLVVPKIKK
jgi:hypothetical protein